MYGTQQVTGLWRRVVGKPEEALGLEWLMRNRVRLTGWTEQGGCDAFGLELLDLRCRWVTEFL